MADLQIVLACKLKQQDIVKGSRLRQLATVKVYKPNRLVTVEEFNLLILEELA